MHHPLDAESAIRGFFGEINTYWSDRAGDSVGSMVFATAMTTFAAVGEGVALSPFAMVDQAKAFYNNPSLETVPILGPTGVSIGETTAAAAENPSAVNISKAVGAYAQGFGVALGGVQALRSAGVSSSVPTPTAGQKVYRVYGGDSAAGGASWSPVNPSNVPNFRKAAGLPSGGASGVNNTGRFVIEGTLVDPSKVVKARRALIHA